jgi:hypothetical protein
LTEFKSYSELECAEYFGSRMDNNGVIFSGFRWDYNLRYYTQEHKLLLITNASIHPDYQMNNNTNESIFQEMEIYDNIYIILDNYQIKRGIYGIDDHYYEKMDYELQDLYDQRMQFNRICVSGDSIVYIYIK